MSISKCTYFFYRFRVLTICSSRKVNGIREMIQRLRSASQTQLGKCATVLLTISLNTQTLLNQLKSAVKLYSALQAQHAAA
jgi:hypothetical protein